MESQKSLPTAFLRSRRVFLLIFLALLALNSGIVASRAWSLGVNLWPSLSALFLVNLIGVLWIWITILRKNMLCIMQNQFAPLTATQTPTFLWKIVF